MTGKSTERIRTRQRVVNAKQPMTDQERLDAPSRINSLPEVTETDPGLKREQEVARTELLMLKGFYAPAQLMTMLGWPRQKTERMIALVRARWEITGKERTLSVRRGQQISRLEMIMTEGWTMFQNSDDERAKVVILESLSRINKQLSDLHGLTPKAIARLMQSSEDKGDLSKRINKQEQLAAMAVQLANILRRNRGEDAVDVTAKTIEHAN